MAPERKIQPLCAWCGNVRVKAARNKWCSQKCAAQGRVTQPRRVIDLEAESKLVAAKLGLQWDATLHRFYTFAWKRGNQS